MRRITVTSACLKRYILCFISPTIHTVGSQGPRGLSGSSLCFPLLPQSRDNNRKCAGLVSWYSSIMKALNLLLKVCKIENLCCRSSRHFGWSWAKVMAEEICKSNHGSSSRLSSTSTTASGYSNRTESGHLAKSKSAAKRCTSSKSWTPSLTFLSVNISWHP